MTSKTAIQTALRSSISLLSCSKMKIHGLMILDADQDDPSD